VSALTAWVETTILSLAALAGANQTERHIFEIFLVFKER